MAHVNGVEVLMNPAEIVRKLEHDSLIGFDTETTGFSPWRNNIALMQFYGNETNTLGVVQAIDGIIPEPILELFKQGKTFVGHNLVSFDIPFIHTHGVQWRKSKYYDTLVGETVVTSNGRRNISVSLRNSVRRKLGLEIDKDIEHGHWGAHELSPEQIIYAASDVISLPALMYAQQQIADETGQTEALLMEMELMPSVASMTINGLPINVEILRAWTAEQKLLADAAEAEIFAALGPLNLNSPKQIVEAFWRMLEYRIKGSSREVLMDVYLDHKAPPAVSALAGKILEYKNPAQRLKMYSEDWIAKHITNGYIHPKYWQCSADTSRFTCSDPNIQQWPKDARKIVGHLSGYKVVMADFSQIEVRIAAELAHDSQLIADLESSDVHRAVASSVYGLPVDDISTHQRRRAKALTFALLFDGTASTLYKHAKVSGGDMSFSEAIGMERTFFTTYQGLAKMRSKAQYMAQNQRVVIVRLPNGLRRVLFGQTKRASTILNTMIQGTAAVGLKKSIIEADKRGLVERYLGAPIHDELVSIVPDNEAIEYSKELSDAMVFGMHEVMNGTVRVEAKVNDFWEA